MVLGVPLFSGSMYGAVGSYMVRVYRLFDLRFDRYPRQWVLAVLAALVYANFFGHHFVWDARYVLLALVVLLFGATTMHARVHRTVLRMPVLVAMGLVALFIWVAENVATWAGVLPRAGGGLAPGRPHEDRGLAAPHAHLGRAGHVGLPSGSAWRRGSPWSGTFRPAVGWFSTTSGRARSRSP